MELQELRAALGEVLRKEQDLTRHTELFESLRPHSIRPLPASDPRTPRAAFYTSFGYALGLADSDRYTAIASAFRNIHADGRFVLFLLKTLAVEKLDPAQAEDDDLVVYFKGTEPVHAGRVSGDDVVSKWGIGNLWSHGVLELPIAYGDDVQYFRHLEPAVVEATFIKYAQHAGVQLHKVPGFRAETARR